MKALRRRAGAERVSRRTEQREEARRRDLALVLPGLGLLMLLPPLMNLFTRRVLLWEIPLEVIYLFTVWALLIVGAAVFSHRVRPGRDAPREAERDRE